MINFDLDNIDYFYYHSTDFDVTRLYSILNNGILSANQIKEKNIPYYHRNYINSSCKDDYVSVSHFPRTIFTHFRIKNELYDNSINKIIFILNGEIDAEDKKYYNRKYEYTNERHVKDGILIKNISGIAIRNIYIDKEIKYLPFIINYSNELDQIKKCFDTIKFLNQIHSYNDNVVKLHVLIGKYMENKVMNNNEKKIIQNEICTYMKNYLANAYKEILNIDNPTLKNVIDLYNKENIPIYVMSKYDIKLYKDRDSLIVSNKYNENIKAVKKVDKIISTMRESDRKIYENEVFGPLSIDGYQKVKDIKRVQNKI